MKNIALILLAALVLASCSANPNKPITSSGGSGLSLDGQSTSQPKDAAAVPFSEEAVRSQLVMKNYLFDTGFYSVQAIVTIDNPTAYDLNITCNIKMFYDDGTEAYAEEIVRTSVDKGHGTAFVSTLELEDDSIMPTKMEYELTTLEEDTSGKARLHNYEFKEEKTDNSEVVITVKNISDKDQYPLDVYMLTFKKGELMCLNIREVGNYPQAPGEVWVSEPIRGTEPVEDTWKVYYFSEE